MEFAKMGYPLIVGKESNIIKAGCTRARSHSVNVP